MTSILKKALAIAGIATFAGTMASTADAALMVKYSVNGAAFTTVTDNGAGDSSAGTGTILLSLGGLGGISIGMGVGNNFDYQPGDPIQLHLNTFANVSNTPANDSLEIWVTSTDYVEPAGSRTLVSDLGVSANPGTVTWEAYIDTTNAAFGTGTQLATQTTSAAGAAAGKTDIDTVALSGGPFSLSQRFVFTWVRTAAINVVGTQEFPVPEPATLALMGAGLLGIGAIRRRRKA